MSDKWPPLVTCRFNPDPHRLIDECQDVTYVDSAEPPAVDPEEKNDA
jgi:hypothetical protein